ncbi:MAG: helix-turn-helix domain-containing protein [Christensenellaceae bacterium]|nr:helix-turn-helix domain-containing protein [Christensenellaceae bacterium]
MLGNLIPLKEYAEIVGVAPSTIRHKIRRGNFPEAVKLGRDWYVPKDTPYKDNRIRTGEYKNWRNKNNE